MRKFLWLPVVLLMLQARIAHAQEKPHLDLEHIYDPAADAAADLAKAQKQAAAEKKHILIEVGGNWCIWCKRFYKMLHEDDALLAQAEKNYVIYYLNYSKENKNLPILKQLGYPQRFGFPVLLVLDANGNRLHTQNTGLLESADNYDKKKVAEMLKQWSPDALNPAYYTTQ